MAKNSMARTSGSSGRSIAGALEQAVSNVVNAASVAATGSEVGVLELAVEDDLKVRRPPGPARKTKKAAIKRTVAASKAPKTARKPARKAGGKTARKTARKTVRKPARKSAVARRRSR